MSDLKLKWQAVEAFFAQRFADNEIIDLDAMLFLIGVRELGKGKATFKKDDKLNLMHIAVCRLLEPFGYYRYDGEDSNGWPQFEFLMELPSLKANEQSILMKQAIVQYFEEQDLFPEDVVKHGTIDG